MNAAHQLGQKVGRAAACRALRVPRASLYRHFRPPREHTDPPVPRTSPPRALAPAERQLVLNHLNAERFQDKAPAEVYATLLDEGTYLCSLRTIYRILQQAGEVRERRDQLRHPYYQKPQLLATAPNQIWSWDITKLLGPVKWTYFYLYVILDIFSRYVVGWMVADRESAELAKRFIDGLAVAEEESREAHKVLQAFVVFGMDALGLKSISRLSSLGARSRLS